MEDQTIKCPRCEQLLEADSVRHHIDGRKKTYWECDGCDLSIMDRGR